MSETHTYIVREGSNGYVLRASPGSRGPKGDQGIKGDTGATGPGVRSGGDANDVLVKLSSTDYDTTWTSTVSFSSIAPALALASGDKWLVVQSGVPGMTTGETAREWFIAGISGTATGAVAGVLSGNLPTPAFSSQAAAEMLYAATTVSGQLTTLTNDLATVSTSKATLTSSNTFTSSTVFSGATTTFNSGIYVDHQTGVASLTLNALNAAQLGVSHGDESHINFTQGDSSLWRLNAGTFLGVTNLFAIDDLSHSRAGLVVVAGGAAGSAFTTVADRLLVKRGTAGQTANLQEWQNDSGAVLAAVTASGRISAVAPTADTHLTTLGAARTNNRQEPQVKTNGYSLVSGDVNRTIVMSNGASRTFTIGSEVAWRSGDYFRLARRGGSHKIAASGATVLEAAAGTSASVSFSAAGGVIECEHLGSNRWLLWGDVSA